MILTLKPDLKLGVATAATQIEGGEVASNWNDWYHQGRILDHSDPANANDHYHRVEEDIALLKSLHIKVYRMGVEWARIEPEPGIFDQAVLEHYREEILLLKKHNIDPLLTLYHFSHPVWFAQMGGFLHPDALSIFARYTQQVLDCLGDIVDEYITINEPNVYATQCYFFNLWPPGEKSLSKTIKVTNVLCNAHIQTYKQIHCMLSDRQVKVSFAHHMRVFEPENPKNPWHLACTEIMRRFFQDGITQACFLGKFTLPLKNTEHYEEGEYIDFIAINYYTRTTVTGLHDKARDGSYKNDLGWEIYPQGIVEVAENLYQVLSKPIYITENGTCDNLDCFRSRYIYDHLKAITLSDLPFVRYYHWSFLDNFEWIEGESARFGLVHCNYQTQQRTIKESGYFFKALIEDGGVSEASYETYIYQKAYHR